MEWTFPGSVEYKNKKNYNDLSVAKNRFNDLILACIIVCKTKKKQKDQKQLIHVWTIKFLFWLNDNQMLANFQSISFKKWLKRM